MNKKLIIIGVLGLAGFGYYFYNKKKKDTPVLADTSEDETNVSTNYITSTKNRTSTTSTSINVKPDWDKILKLGSKGIEVTTLQKAIKKVDVDGDFGSSTEKRLKSITGFNQISVNQYNDFIKSKPVVKPVVKKQVKQEVVSQIKPTTSFTAGLITTL
jgi:hypothetical protein